jgi:hypothetical protein
MPALFYRAVPTLSPADADVVHGWRGTVCLPSNVPYVVDNVWEHLRPSHMPCRRYAVYASSKPELALQCAAPYERRHRYTAYPIRIAGAYKIAQLNVKDARDHEDIRHLQKLIKQHQPAWATLSWESRQQLAMLFSPGATKEDLNRLIDEDQTVASFMAEAAELSRFWPSARAPVPESEGELFFELAETATYRLLQGAHA